MNRQNAGFARYKKQQDQLIDWLPIN